MDTPDGVLELRVRDEDKVVTGHYKAFGNSGRYHNTAALVVDEKFDRRQIKTLLHYAVGFDFTPADESDLTIAIVGLPGVRAS